MFEVVTREGKPGVMFEAAVRAPGVRLMIETEKNGIKALLMTKEIRREADGYDFRLPGGKVFDSLDELDQHSESGTDILPIAEAAAKKEGKQEAGISGGEYVLLEYQRQALLLNGTCIISTFSGLKLAIKNSRSRNKVILKRLSCLLKRFLKSFYNEKSKKFVARICFGLGCNKMGLLSLRVDTLLLFNSRC